VSARRTAIAATFACVAGFAVAHAATDGFEAFTLESARRLHALRAPAPVPDLALDLADGATARISQLPARVLLVDFVYTNCLTYCSALGSVYAQLQRQLAAEIATGDVQLLSITFDPGRDGASDLRAYRARNGASAAGWNLGRPAQADLRTWLDAFGVVVIPDGLGGYTHNAAVHLVGPNRTLAEILDPGDLDAIVQATRHAIAR
jgi:protein SCO1/2